MLVISRRKNESIIVGDVIEITVVEVRGDKVRLGVVAPKEMTVHRGEVEDVLTRESRPISQPIEKLVGPGLVPRGPLLVLSRKKNESIVINGDITVIVVDIRADKARLGIELPREIMPHRREVYEAIKRNAPGTTTPRERVMDQNDVKSSAHETGNLFDNIPADIPEEVVTTVLRANGLRIERIVSQGQASPPGFWYDQEDNEWVVVLEGHATVQFEGEPESVELQRGSYVNIPAHVRHRVAWTDPNQKTVWLAIHYRD